MSGIPAVLMAGAIPRVNVALPPFFPIMITLSYAWLCIRLCAEFYTQSGLPSSRHRTPIVRTTYEQLVIILYIYYTSMTQAKREAHSVLRARDIVS